MKWLLSAIHNALGWVWHRLGKILEYTKRWDRSK